MATIQLVGVTRQFAAQGAALDGVDLTAPGGETLAIVGPSGSGKSTLLRIVAGLDGEYRGAVLYDGRDMRDVAPKERHIGMVFQNYALYPHFLGRGNLSFFFRLRRTTDAETEERIRITAEIMGIGFEELLKRKPGTLSGGQQQRVAIGRAIVRNPELMLLDEPLSNLDAKLRTQTRIEIKRLLHRFRITALYVTHDQTEAIALGDQIAVLRAGRVEQVGPVMTLLHTPANAFVAGFVGTPPMNLLAGGVVREYGVELDAWQTPLPVRLRGKVYAGQELIVGVRPEAAQVLDTDAPRAGAIWQGSVELVEPDLARRIQWVHVRRNDQMLVASAAVEHPLYVGSPVRVILPAEELHFFDAATELRL